MMALIECPECKREISDLAKTCPGCAYPIKAAADKAAGHMNPWVAALLVTLAVAGGSYFFWWQNEETQKARAALFDSECNEAEATVYFAGNRYLKPVEDSWGKKCSDRPRPGSR